MIRTTFEKIMTIIRDGFCLDQRNIIFQPHARRVIKAFEGQPFEQLVILVNSQFLWGGIDAKHNHLPCQLPTDVVSCPTNLNGTIPIDVTTIITTMNLVVG